MDGHKVIAPSLARLAEPAIPVIRTTLVQNFTMPTIGQEAVAQVGNSTVFTVGQVVFLSNIGWLQITDKG